jgi:polyisoprenoid-binding protein YceI
LTRRRVVIAGVLVVVAAGAGLTWYVVGGDAPPPPALAPGAVGSVGDEPAGTRVLSVSRDGSFVGYRVREEYLSFGVKGAVGRTASVSGTVRVRANRITAAELTADPRTLRSDEARRDSALRGRAPIHARLRGQRLDTGAVEVVGTAPIPFGAFGIVPPSVAGFVTVRDHGTLEFRLRLR